MNLLAHAVLTPAGAAPGVLVGNVVADWIKGKARHALPDDLRAGIALHRRIDTFTDTHPLVASCASLLEPRWGRYSTVLVDILFDHVLSAEWDRYCPTPRPAFIAATYAALRDHLDALPWRAQYATNALLADDWFTCYATADGIALSLSRLSGRLNHHVELAPAIVDFHAHRAAFHESFRHFFPALAAHALAVMRDGLAEGR
jgi:acyl carrier protein phosphodiesterase